MDRSVLLVLCFVPWLSISSVQALGALSPLDPSSFSRPELSIIKHISLSLNVDFENKILNGIAVLNIDVLQEINEVILDLKKLDVESIEADDGIQLKFTIDNEVPNFGSKLTINLPNSTASGDKVKLKIKYNTSPDASALQWLKPAQTSGKKHPYLYSQSSPIHARSVLPCQDTLAVKFTYDAEVTAPPEFTVLMSALKGEVNGNVTSFYQPIPISSNLMAIAVGALEYRNLGPRSKVWSEKEEVDKSAWEFTETEKYLEAAERLCGPYVWGQYDLLVLPPSFPYGGMENPCLTFVTPTLLTYMVFSWMPLSELNQIEMGPHGSISFQIKKESSKSVHPVESCEAGDRSQADVIIHEIMHSWTGNLVTNRNFEHFWLKEGFTVFLERKLSAALIADKEEGKRNRDFHSILGLQSLKEIIDQLGSTNPITKLVLDLKGVHPDDSFSTVPYEKGSLFLRYLEDLLGGPEVFDDYVRSFIKHFAKKSLDTDQFKEFTLNYFKGNDQLKKVDWDTWLHHTGMPPVIPNYDTSMTKGVTALVTQIISNASISSDDVKDFTPHQIIYFLQSLIHSPTPLPLSMIQAIGEAYGLIKSKNAEIQYRWLRLCIRSKAIARLDEVFLFLNSHGRMKYVRPLYRDLYAWEAVRHGAIDNFLENEKYMMHVTAYNLRQDLHLAQ